MSEATSHGSVTTIRRGGMEENRYDESMVIATKTRASSPRALASGGRSRCVGLQQQRKHTLADRSADNGADTDTNDGAHADASCADAVG